MPGTTSNLIGLASIKKLIVTSFFAAIISGCYSNNINLKVPFDTDIDMRLPFSVGLYFPEDNVNCNYSRSDIYKQSHPSINFDIAEMTVSYWPEVFQSVFSDVEVSEDGSSAGVQENTDIVIKVSCKDFSLDRGHYYTRPWHPIFDVYDPWTKGGIWIVVDFAIEFSCPSGDQFGAYDVRGYSKLLYTEGWSITGILPPLKRKTRMAFQQAGHTFVKEILPEIEALAARCPA